MKKRHLLIALAALALPLAVQAQYTIYPIPHTMTAGTGTVSFTPTVTIVSEAGIDDYTTQRAAEILKEKGIHTEISTTASSSNSNVYLGVNGGTGAPSATAAALGLSTDVLTKSGKFDRHILSLSDAGNGTAQLVVIGENTDAAFCGLASLEQMLDGGTSDLPAVVINDYADQQNRGIVEGYYGLPYSLDVKKDLMRFMKRYKLNTYLYGAKCDYYHSNHWQDAYPTSITAEQEKMGYMTQSMMKELTATAHECKVNFIWAIHPGNNLVNSSTVVADVVNKYAMMYKLGVRQFAVFADDVSVPDTDEGMKTTADHITAIQQAIEAKWNKTYTTAADTVRPLQFVPQIYCRAFASSADQFNRFFNALSSIPSSVTIYTTGWGVWSVPNNSDFNTTQDQLGRQVAWWWNYPCNDNGEGKSQIYPMDMYSNFADMPNVTSSATLPSEITASTCGIVSNPMCQGEVSKTALFSVADYAWNNKGFDNLTSWEASFKGILPGNEKAQAAYRFLAPYLRYNDPATLNTLITRFKSTKKATDLIALMDEIVTNCETMQALESSTVDGERLLYNDLQTWLLRLHDMAAETKSLLTLATQADKDETVWPAYLTDKASVNALQEADKYKATILSGSIGSTLSTSLYLSKPAEKYLRPFLTGYLLQHSLDNFFAKDEASSTTQYISSRDGLPGRARTSGSYQNFYNSKVVTLQPGDFIGLQLAKTTRIKSIEIKDTLFANNTFLISDNGKDWKELSEATSTPDGYVHYLLLANTTNEAKPVKVGMSQIKVYPVTATTISAGTVPDGDIWQSHNAEYMYDGDYTTFVCLKRNQKAGDAYTVELSEAQPIQRVRIYMGTTNGDYMTEGNVQISEDGNSWTSIPVLGTFNNSYKLSLSQNKVISDEVTACDFEGRGKTAKYVRLYVNTPNTSKWLRLYEIAVNPTDSYEQAALQQADGTGLGEATDADASTSTADAALSKSTKNFVYYLQDYKLINEIKFYCDPATLDNAEFAITHDGSSWTTVAPTIANGIATLTLDEDTRDIRQVRIAWTGTTVPDIYEITTDEYTAAKPEVTGIESVTTAGATAGAPEVGVHNGHITVASAKGIRCVEVYSADGRKLFSESPAGEKQVTLPAIHGAAGAGILRVTLTDGTQFGYKVL